MSSTTFYPQKKCAIIKTIRTSSGVAHFRKQLTRYRTSKGTIQFPLDKPIPFDLIRKIVLFRVKENLAKAEAKK